MCGCKDCKEVTLLSGTDGRGIVSITRNGNGTFTYLFTDGTIYVTPNLTGAEGPEGPQGPAGPPGMTLVEYITDLIGPDTSGTIPTYTALSPFTYTVPTGTATADYDITFIASVILDFDPGDVFHQVNATIYKNGSVIDFAYVKGFKSITFELETIQSNLTTSAIVSLAAGDTIDIYSTSSKPANAHLSGGIFKVYKLG